MEFPVYSRIPITISRGEGMRVWDDHGVEYLDFYGGHAVAALGYGHPGLTRAIQDQTAKLLFQSNAAPLAIRDAACSALVAAAPDGLESVFLVNSGSEANENAIRLAFLHTGRSRVVALKGSFHGRTAASAAVTWGAAESWYGFPSLPFEVTFVDPEDFSALTEVLSDDVAAFIFEPVQGVAGAVAISAEFAQLARKICTERGIVMIADEVQTGIGRTGTMFAVEQLGVIPDLMTLAKGLGGGFPVGAVLGQAAFIAKTKIGTLGTTFGGGPVACAAISAVLDAVSSPDFLENVRVMSTAVTAEIRSSGISCVSGKGLLLGLHFGKPVAEIRSQLLAHGIISGDAKNPNIVRLLPPLILGPAEIETFGKALGEVLK
ncbi:MAG: aminotransferase class III-fold pyridoxal phosphate-dependent enzyme [Armatimonadetes bacterium]|nr:aminotransferase class III-fold pyridoxal phosphate-dependent enzyme [Armatimonadota bacterium]